jgi:hypothetical protein
MPRGWIKDMNLNIMPGGGHWDRGLPPSTTRVRPQYRTCMSFNIATNLFGPDSDDGTSPGDSKFKSDYYEAPIKDVLGKFARRFRQTLPIGEGATADLDEKEILLKRTVEIGADLFDSAALLASGLGGLPMKSLYIKDDFLANQAVLLPILSEMDYFRRVVNWICIPFLEYSRDSTDKPTYPRPDKAAYDAHVDGHDDPVLPSGQHIGGPVLGVGTYSFAEFTYIGAGGNPTLGYKITRARQFAAEWGFFDPLSIVDRRHVNSGSSAPDAEEKYFASNDIGIKSSGNGYKCDGVSCKPSNASSFCVSTSCP